MNTIKLDQPTNNCPLCKRSRDEALDKQFVKRGIGYLRCPCGLYYADQYMSEDETRAWYSDGEYRRKHPGSVSGDDHWEREHAAVLVPMIIKELPGCDKILDIGCSTGVLLEKLQDFYDCTVHGLEWSKIQREQTIKRGLKCYQDFSEVESNRYDLIILSHVLEHTLHPLELLERIQDVLKGVLFIQVPIMMPAFPHPLVFTVATAMAMVEKAGYKIISTDNRKHFTIWARR